ncbi:MAG: c-type cytochrome, partial [Bryobacteraceae bacterium]
MAQTAGPFTAQQAASGRAAYQANCQGCHLPDLSGRNEAPQLAGANFFNTWENRSTRDLFSLIQTSMPPDNAGALDTATYADLVAFILQSNGARSGSVSLSASTDVRIGSIATGVRIIADSTQAAQPTPTAGPAVRHG